MDGVNANRAGEREREWERERERDAAQKTIAASIALLSQEERVLFKPFQPSQLSSQKEDPLSGRRRRSIYFMDKQTG